MPGVMRVITHCAGGACVGLFGGAHTIADAAFFGSYRPRPAVGLPAQKCYISCPPKRSYLGATHHTHGLNQKTARRRTGQNHQERAAKRASTGPWQRTCRGARNGTSHGVMVGDCAAALGSLAYRRAVFEAVNLELAANPAYIPSCRAPCDLGAAFT